MSGESKTWKLSGTVILVSGSLNAAWQPSFKTGLLNKVFGERRTVIRGSFGLFYDRVPLPP